MAHKVTKLSNSPSPSLQQGAGALKSRQLAIAATPRPSKDSLSSPLFSDPANANQVEQPLLNEEQQKGSNKCWNYFHTFMAFDNTFSSAANRINANTAGLIFAMLKVFAAGEVTSQNVALITGLVGTGMYLVEAVVAQGIFRCWGYEPQQGMQKFVIGLDMLVGGISFALDTSIRTEGLVLPGQYEDWSPEAYFTYALTAASFLYAGGMTWASLKARPANKFGIVEFFNVLQLAFIGGGLAGTVQTIVNLAQGNQQSTTQEASTIILIGQAIFSLGYIAAYFILRSSTSPNGKTPQQKLEGFSQALVTINSAFSAPLFLWRAIKKEDTVGAVLHISGVIVYYLTVGLALSEKARNLLCCIRNAPSNEILNPV